METNNLMGDTPTFQAIVYDNLPPFLKDCISPFKETREKDVMLTSSIVVLSGCFSQVSGKYGNDWVHPNIFGFVVAPPASGKGIMKYARMLGQVSHKELVSQNGIAKEKYEAELKIWNRLSKKNRSSAGNPPVRPMYPVLFIPGNSSAASIYRLLAESGGIGIICESEADTLSGALCQDWGNFSHMLRCAFHHEPLTLSRNVNETYINIDEPCLSVLLTGTPDQVSRIISSAEDGLFSRNLYYYYDRKLEWINPTPCNDCPDLVEYFIELSGKVATVRKVLDQNKFTFKLTESQFSTLSENFNSKLKQIEVIEGAEAASVLFRLGLIAFRIAMLLTVVRNMDTLSVSSGQLICTDQDFENALRLTDVYFEHSMLMFSLLPKKGQNLSNPKMRRFYTLLPRDQKFARKKANEVGAKLGISERTVGNYIDRLEEKGLLESAGYGEYTVTPK